MELILNITQITKPEDGVSQSGSLKAVVAAPRTP
jgi:hypothetical protein